MDTNKKEPRDLVYNKIQYLKRCQEIGRFVYEDTFRINGLLINALLQIRDAFLYNQTINNINSLELKEGLFVNGRSNSGKTALMVILRTILDTSKSFKIISCLEIEHQFKKYGKAYLENLFDDRNTSWCFDDFGKRSTESHYSILRILIEKIFESKNTYHIISDFTLEQLHSKLGLVYYNKIKSKFITIKT